MLLVDVSHPNTYYIAPGRDFILSQTSDGDSASERLHQPHECTTRSDLTEYYPQSYTKYHYQLPFVPDDLGSSVSVKEPGRKSHSNDLDDDSSIPIKEPASHAHTEDWDDRSSFMTALDHVENTSYYEAAHPEVSLFHAHCNIPLIKFQKQTLTAVNVQIADSSRRTEPAPSAHPDEEPEPNLHSNDLDDDSSIPVIEPEPSRHLNSGSTDTFSVPSFGLGLLRRATSDPLSTRSEYSSSYTTHPSEAATDVSAPDPLPQNTFTLAPFFRARKPSEDSWDQGSVLTMTSSITAVPSIESHHSPDPTHILPLASSDPSTSRNLTEGSWDRRSMSSTISSLAAPSIESRDSEMSLSLAAPFRACTQEQLQVFCRHNSLWKNLDTLKSVTWDCFPWPVFQPPVTPEDLKQGDVTVYLRLLHGIEKNRYITAEEHIKEHVRRWHPDRLEAKVWHRVVERDREKVQLWSKKVARVLAMILVDCQRSN
jgi:hypothetical protein